MACARLLRTGCYDRIRLLNELRCIVLLPHRTVHRRKGGHDVVSENEFGRSSQGRLELVESAEQAEDSIIEEMGKDTNTSREEEIKHQRRVKFKIIEKKYFKRAQDLNLLTWDAKEQMRYLHNEYPDEWTVDRLAESFPVSFEGVIKVLKSQWRPKSLPELLRHDRSVRKRWLALSGGEKDAKGGGGPLEERYQKMLDDGKLCNAAGITRLPIPETRLLLHQPESTAKIVSSVIPLPEDQLPGNARSKKLVDIVAGALQRTSITAAKSETEIPHSPPLLESKKQNHELLKQVIVGLPKATKKELSYGALEPRFTGDEIVKNRRMAKRTTAEKSQHNSINEVLGGPRKGDRVSMFDSYIEADMRNREKEEQDRENAFLAQARATLDGEMEIPAVDDYDVEKNVSQDNEPAGGGGSGYSFKEGPGPHSFITPKGWGSIAHGSGSRPLPLQSYSSHNTSSQYSPDDAPVEGYDDPFNVPTPSIRRRGRRRLRKIDSQADLNISQLTTDQSRGENPSMTAYERLQMEGTGKISSQGKKSSPSDYEKEEDIVAGVIKRTGKFSPDPNQERLMEDLRYDVPQSRRDVGGESVEEAYVYSPTSGYQHPLGKVDPELRIDVPEEHKSETRRRYQKGNAIYDENGDLLFRVPQ